MFILMIFVSLFSNCSSERKDSQPVMTVEFDIFSGKPNPTWVLSKEESLELTDLLKDLPPANMPTDESGLGYRGFLLSNPEMMGGLPSVIHIYKGVVEMKGNHIQYYQDAHGVEHKLLQQASQRGYKDIVDGLLKE